MSYTPTLTGVLQVHWIGAAKGPSSETSLIKGNTGETGIVMVFSTKNSSCLWTFNSPYQDCLTKISLGTHLVSEVFQNKREYIFDDNKDIRVHIDYILRLEQKIEERREIAET